MTDQRTDDDAMVANRRRVLQLGAVGAVAVVSVKPAFAQVVASLHGQIPIPSGAIDASGNVVPAGTVGAVPGGVTYQEQDVYNTIKYGYTLRGATYEQHYAHLAYIKKLQAGQSGFTCYASIVSRP